VASRSPTPPGAQPLRGMPAGDPQTFAQQDLLDYAHWASSGVSMPSPTWSIPGQALADFFEPSRCLRSLDGLCLGLLAMATTWRPLVLLLRSPAGVKCADAPLQLASSLDSARAGAGQGPGCGALQPGADHRSVAAVWRCPTPSTPMSWPRMGQEPGTNGNGAGLRRLLPRMKPCWRRADPRAIRAWPLPCRPTAVRRFSAGVIDGPASRVFDQADNRLLLQQGAAGRSAGRAS